MIERYKNGSLTWVDVLSPSSEEVRELFDEFNLSPELVGDLTGPVPRSEAVESGNVIKMTMDFPIVKRTDIDHPHELKFLIGKKFLITVRYEDMEAIHHFQKEFEVVSTLKKPGKTAVGAHLFFGLMNELYKSQAAKLDYLETRMNNIEEEVFKAHEKEMVNEIASIGRKLISFRQNLSAHDDVYREAKAHFERIFGTKVLKQLVELHGQYFFLTRRVNGLFETFIELRNTNMAILSTKQNEVMKILTIMAFVTFPLSLFAAMFGMNTQTLPLTGYPGDFWIIIGIMTCATIGFFVFFKYKHWI